MKVLNKWVSPDENYIRKYCKGYLTESQIEERLKLTHSIVMECSNCNKDCWLMITKNQEEGLYPIKCPICQFNNLI